jgi:heptosyltransferase-2
MKIVVWQTAFLGDLILTTPLFHSIKNIFPESDLHVITKPFGEDVLKNNPYVDSVIVYDKKDLSNIRLIKKLREEKFDIAVSPHRSHRASYSLFLSNIPFRVGFDKAGFSFLYTKTVPHRFDGTHEINRNLSLLSVFPEYTENKLHTDPEIFLTEEEEKFFERFSLEKKKYILVAAGSKWETKRWTVKGFSQLIDILSERGEEIVLIGSKEDRQYTDIIIKNTKAPDRVIDLTGKTSLRESFSIIKNAKALISNDSAPVHMAVAFDVPVVDIYGPTVTDFGFYPYKNGVVVEIKGLECRPCGLHGHKKCPTGTFECMEKITPDMVVKALYEVI